MNISIILQTCTINTNQEGERYCGAKKPEITRRCCISLSKSIDYAIKNIEGLDVDMTVIDDHSDEWGLINIDNIFRKTPGYKRINLESSGVMQSILACYEYGYEHGEKGLVYFAQDDYLYEKSAIKEMIEAYMYFRYNLGGAEVGIYPFNDPYRYYIPSNIELSRLVHGPNRHWRTNFFTASCFMVNYPVLYKNWDLFYNMGHCDAHDQKMEDKTINKLWQERGIYLFSPIPSLALHMQFETEKDPYIDWEIWWENNKAIV